MASLMESLKTQDQDKLREALDRIKQSSAEDSIYDARLPEDKHQNFKKILNKYNSINNQEVLATPTPSPEPTPTPDATEIPQDTSKDPEVDADNITVPVKDVLNHKPITETPINDSSLMPQHTPKSGDGRPGIFSELFGQPAQTDTDFVPPNTNPIPAPTMNMDQATAEQIMNDAKMGASTGMSEKDLADLPENVNTVERFPSSQDDSGTGLKAAQEAANKNQLYANLMHSANLIGSGIGGAVNQGITPAKLNDKEQYDTLIKNADAPIDQYKEQVADQKNDPNSKYSRELRDFLNKSIPGLNIPENTSGSAIEKAVPWINTNNRYQQIAKNNLSFKQSAADDRKRGLDNRISNQATSAFDKDTKDEQNRLQAAKRVEDIIHAAKSGTLVDTPNIRNTITNDLSILSMPAGQRSTVTAQQKTALNTLGTKLAELNQWWNDNPTKTTPPKFLTQFEVENGVLKNSWADALRAKTKSLHSGAKDDTAKETIANRYKTFAEDYGIEPDFQKKPEQIKVSTPLAPNEIEATDPKSGKIGIYDRETKKPLRWK